MGRILFLGTSSAVPDLEHENTHILLQTGDQNVLVDCPGSPVIRLSQEGIPINQITSIILTHFHPDHVSGFAPLLMSMWLTGRKQPLDVYGLAETLDRAQQMMSLYSWEDWPNFFPVNFLPIPEAECALAFRNDRLEVFASPVDHLVPTIGLRFNFLVEGRSVTYSCDTQPSQIVRRLAQDSHILIHEATGGSVGHSSASSAGEIATQAGVEALYLIHYPPQLTKEETLLEKASQTFAGEIVVAKDFLSVPIE